MDSKLKTWSFDVNNAENINLVLSGKRNIKLSLYVSDMSSKVGDESILIFDNEKEACITRVKNVSILEFKNINEDMKREIVSINSDVKDNTLIEVINFEVVRDLVAERLELAQRIVDVNLDIFGSGAKVSEINAGFNNSVFNVDDKYVIKVCGNKEKEDLFDVEANFYQMNENSEAIPKLYRYDKFKRDVPFVYEIIEYVKGKSVYYYWYKMDELMRENFVRKLMILIKTIHANDYPDFDWSSYVKTEILDNFNESIDLFSDEEQEVILKSLSLYDEVLSDNHFTLIHSDLHFDNILITEDGEIKIIDFNDSRVAPFDFDLRIFYMCVEQPWKWANTEMDPYQKPEDYANLFEYVKKYYQELSRVKYLDERMIIYSILNDIRHLSEFRNDELRVRVVNNSKRLVNRLKKN